MGQRMIWTAPPAPRRIHPVSTIWASNVQPPRHLTIFMEGSMNQDTLKGQWTQLKGQVREQWGKIDK